ncbi:hypothetical protein FRB99_003404, partial [Tulasnella sp. 403]
MRVLVPSLSTGRPPTSPPDVPEALGMELCPVPEDHELGQDSLWDRTRHQLSSVDLVRFTWLDKNDDQGDQDDDDAQDDDNSNYDDIAPIKPIEDGTCHTTLPTIWVGVLPDTLTSEVAHESATEILGLLKQHGITGVDVAYRDSRMAQTSSVFDLDPLKDAIDNLSTPLSLPIAGLKTKMQDVNESGGDGSPHAQKSAGELEETQGELTKTRTKIDTLKAFFVNVKKKWSKAEDRTIGHVVWAPPIGVAVPPHRYTRDICVIKLDKKFKKFLGNVLDL